MRNLMLKCLSLLLLATFAVATVHADDENEMENLKLFKAGGMQHGQWLMEMLASSDPSMQKMMEKMGKMSICIDIAKQLAKDSAQHQATTCTRKVVNDSANSAEIDLTCADGAHNHMTITRDGDKSFVLDGNMTSKEGKSRTMKARYTYQGECKGDAMIQMDKDSDACKTMHAKTQGMDMSAMCAKAPEQYRAQCEAQMKAVQASCQ